MYYNSKVAVSQINGTFKYQLVPKMPCTKMCKSLNGRLETNHTCKYYLLLLRTHKYIPILHYFLCLFCTVIFNSFIWDFEYLPMNNSTESIAFIYYLD